jgi:primary-amine oxidase
MLSTLSTAKSLCFRISVLSFAVYLWVFGQSAALSNPSSAHPLDPLSKDEIAATVLLLKISGKVSEGSRFSIITLHEPHKVEVMSFRPASLMRREAFAVVYERGTNKTFEAVVDLNNKRVISWKEVPGVQPALLTEDFILMEGIVRADPQWQEAMRKRGIEDFNNVQLDPWGAGYFGFAGEEGTRVVRATSYYKGSTKNAWARPIEGVVAYVNLNAKKVFKLIETGVVPVPQATADLDENSIGKLREGPKPLQVVQPQGNSFELQGNEVRWQNWRFRFAMHQREGLVLYTLGYEDRGKLRSVLYRASLSEMVVPYGDPGPAWFFRNAFDQGEYNSGQYANSLEPLVDCPANAVFFDAVFSDDRGVPFEIPRSVALFERDGGILWKHHDIVGSKQNEARRARQLVLSYFFTAGNYDYGFNWVFHQDGTLEMEALLTGIMHSKGVKSVIASARGHGDENYGHLVAENVVAVNHQHFFNFRLDMDVDGTANSAIELNTEPVPPGPKNPYLNAFVMKETMFRSEQEAQRHLNLASGRKWKVTNPSVKNSLGQPVGYLLVPGENSIPYAAPNSSVRRRAGFINAHLWITRYEPTEANAAGRYPYQSKGREGLPRWISANRSIEDLDIVLWYTMGVTHIPRPEEWPVMPVHRAGFKLIPSGFFIRNPALDVPKSK